MPLATVQLLVDLDDTLNYSTDITNYWKQNPGFDFPTVGRHEDTGLAQPATMSLTLANADGRFTPKNAAGPYFNTWHPYHHAKITVTFNAVVYNIFAGIIKEIDLDPTIEGQECKITLWDLMYVLSRTDIRCPLMRGYTGPIVNRLLDYAEANEKVTNPRFDDLSLLSGYTAMGTGSLTRATGTRPILEGNASLAVSAGAANDGVRYTFPSNLTGQKITIVAYVQARDDANEGNVYIQAEDNVGVKATGADTAIKATRWTRLSVTGTYAGATQFLQVRRSVAGGSPDFVIGAVHATPFVAAMPRSVDEGQTILDAYTYRRGPALKAIQEVAENELGGLFYIDGSGTAIFEDKHHRWVSPHTVSQATFDERGVVAYSESGEDRIKTVVLDFPRFIEGAAGTVLWELDRAPVTIEANATATFEVDYEGGAAIGILPVANTDYTANASPNGGGTNETGNLLVTAWTDWGGGAEVSLQNQAARPIYLTFLQLRGTPIRTASDRTPARASGATGPAIASVISHGFALNGREPSVQAWASYLADRYDDQQARISLRLVSPFPTSETTTDLPQMLARKVSDRMTVTNDNLAFSSKVNSDFYINRISRRFSGGQLVSTWDLVPVEASFFQLDISSLDGADVLAP